jgi:methionine aminopeptidase
MTSLMIEVILDVNELAAQGFDGRDQVEEILENALVKINLGEITGGGTGMGKSMIDIEITDENRIDEALEIIRQTLLDSNLSPQLEVRR